ncbi:30S ribosomal protein S4 [Candidatus Microgenomates bacterium]|nr:30S ribosomal protein S4 [Candidatus Microgenomates bacterium]
MARYTGPKHRLSRREGFNLQDKGSASLSRRLTVPPGVHGPKGTRSKKSDYGLQLREKQKAKRIYCLLEKQFRKYYTAAAKVPGKTGEVLLQSLEGRLDNAVFRLGFVPSRPMARQLVSHGHVMVDGKKVSIPSYALKLNQVVTLVSKAMEMPAVKKMLESADAKVPDYFERKAAAGRMIKVPSREEIPVEVNEQLIIEYYSR